MKEVYQQSMPGNNTSRIKVPSTYMNGTVNYTQERRMTQEYYNNNDNHSVMSAQSNMSVSTTTRSNVSNYEY